jgi:hypothetical protein
LQILNGQSAEDFLNKNRTGIKKAQNQETISETELINSTNFNSPGQVEARRVANQSRTDVLNENRYGREDTNARFEFTHKADAARRAFERGENKMNRRHESELADGSNDLQMQMSIMSNDLSEKRMDYDRETRSMDKRDRMIATLMSGLGSLGGAFAL